jgi:hypothetical protein
MNGDDTIQSPEYSKNKTLEVMKSQKNLNSATYFNVHEEESKPAEIDPKRTNRVDKTEMRETWKRPRVPHHKKLDAFIQYNNKYFECLMRGLQRNRLQKT